MEKKLNLGDKVTMSKSYLDFLLNNALGLYSISSTGRIPKDHHEELACLLWCAYKKQKPRGVVYGINKENVYVIFENEMGQFSGYYEHNDLTKVKKNEKKSVRKIKKRN